VLEGQALSERKVDVAGRNLKNKPLIEAILELKWRLMSPTPGVELDPHYKILIGRMYDRVSTQYPEHEQLPTATLPDEWTGHTVQHRFRSGPNDWPLLQIGPGILTLNNTEKYTWTDFRERSLSAIESLFHAYPKREELHIQSLLLRYIDGVDFDCSTENLLDFLREKLKLRIDLPSSLFTESPVQARPQLFSWQSSFSCSDPKGIVSARFATGQRKGSPALIWETLVQSIGNDIPAMPEGFVTWIDAAHGITDDWFFKLIEGDLERQFNGE
jgi:uncharacterized protein (TIGR04255 family)